MKNKPLYLQLTLVFSLLIMFVGLFFMTIIPATLSSFFTDEIYHTIEETQLGTSLPDHSNRGHMGRMGRGMGMGMGMMQQNVRSADHVFIDESGNVLQGRQFSTNLLSQFYKEALNQTDESARYEIDVEDKLMLYVIKKHQTELGDVFQISYMWDTYRKQLTSTLIKKMSSLLIIASIIAVILAILFSKWLVKPIQYMKDFVAQITAKNWHQPLILNRSDELGELAKSIDNMRLQLKRQDEEEKSLLQQISHDLKTPVMVIRSYADALKDGVYPNGSIEGTAKVIDVEAKNLEKKIKDLLLLTKLDYLQDAKLTTETVEMSELIESVIERLHPYRCTININKNIEKFDYNCNKEQLTVLIENLLDNALKYADQYIDITSYVSDDYYIISCKNDGKPIEEERVAKVFQPFIKGESGNFGLGLTIMKRIVDLHNGRISFESSNNETKVLIKLPLS